MSRAWALLERVDAPDYDEPDENYMTRWRVFSTPWLGLYIHRLDKPDPRPTLHDHPWPFLSLVMRGGYREDFAACSGCDRASPAVRRRTRSWPPGSVHRMRKTDTHTITSLRRSPTWTLVLVGRRHPEPSWGYREDTGWTPWDEHPHATEFANALAQRQRASSQAEVRPAGRQR
jgi:hypothetical protein